MKWNMDKTILYNFAVLMRNGKLLDDAASLLMEHAGSKYGYVWIEKQNGEIVELERGDKIKTAEISPVFCDEE